MEIHFPVALGDFLIVGIIERDVLNLFVVLDRLAVHRESAE